jgi:tripartite-type tricarboxylate transporter receptor subunit TctC
MQFEALPNAGRAMTVNRRQLLSFAIGVVAPLAAAGPGSAQTYPERPVRVLVGFPAGGQIDIIARLIGQWLTDRLGQQFFIDNRPGAASNIAAEALIRAVPDGYTLFLANGTNAVNATLYNNLRFDFARDTAPVASINRIPLVLYAHPSFQAKTVPELIAYAKANPNKLSIATPPKGTGPAMAAELFKITAGLELLLSDIARTPKSSLMCSEDKCRSRSAASLLFCHMCAPASCVRSR